MPRNIVRIVLGIGLSAVLGHEAPAIQTEPQQDSVMTRAVGWTDFPRPDPQTLAWLASRIPGLAAQNVRTISLEAADLAMQQAWKAKETYLDILTSPYFQRGQNQVYYVPQDVLERIDQKYIHGALRVSGTTTEDQPFHMQALVVGGSYVHFLYDQTQEFRFKDKSNEIKITNAGHVAAQIQGAADVTIQGVGGCGCLLFICGCAEIQRMTKMPDGKLSVETSRGPQTQNIRPIRLRQGVSFSGV